MTASRIPSVPRAQRRAARLQKNRERIPVPRQVLFPSVHRISRDECAVGFSVVVQPFSANQLAKVSGATKEAAKAWKNAESCPRLDHLINMARRIDVVRDWMHDEIRQESINHILALAQRVAATETGEQAILARALIRQAQGGGE